MLTISAAETTRRILISTVDEFWDAPTPDLRLETIARKAKVTVQTILRQFGSKENLLFEATKFESERIQAIRDPNSVNDVESAVHQLVTHYEVMGDRVMRMLAEEFHIPSLAPIVDTGRIFHRNWCRHVFDRTLVSLPSAERNIRFAQLAAICDVYTWKLLRRDFGLSRRATERALIEILKPLIKEN